MEREIQTEERVTRKRRTGEHEDLLRTLREKSEGSFQDRLEDSVDPFHVPPSMVPDGWTVEWKTTHIMGMPVPDSQMRKYTEDGWVPAPIEIFRALKPDTYDRATVDEQGLTLYMRPREITEKKKRQEHDKAVAQVRNNSERIGLSNDGEFDRKKPKVSRSWEKGGIAVE